MSTMSREEMKANVATSLDAALSTLHTIWDEIGICDEQKKDRANVVVLHLRNLLDEMVKEEKILKKNLMQNVETFGKELLHLCKELALPQHEPEEGMSLLQLEKEMRQMSEGLLKMKQERLKELKTLKEQDQHLCDVLCTTPYYVPSGTVPSQDQLKELEQHIATLTQEKDKRQGSFVKTKKEILTLLEELEQDPNTSFERDIVCEEETSFLLSTDNMNALKVLHHELKKKSEENFSMASMLRERLSQMWDRLEIAEEERKAFLAKNIGFKPKVLKALEEEIKRCEKLRLLHMQKFVEAVRRELVTWWDKCYYSPSQRDDFSGFYCEDYNEDLLAAHEEEVQKVKDYYHDFQTVLEMVAKRQKLWNEMIEFEKRASDPNRFFNRGCSLLKEEKQRKKLLKDLPRTEEVLKEEITKWEEQNGKEFLIGGVRFIDYVKNQWEEYTLEKEREKTTRHQKKAREMEEEVRYGSKPTTPAKKRFIGTPAKTPTNKFRKLNDTQKTPGSVSRMGHSTLTSTFAAASPFGRPPTGTAKTPRRLRPTEDRLTRRKVLGERNELSSTTVTSGASASEMSLSSMGTYQDFATLSIASSNGSTKSLPTGLHPAKRPNCRSSAVPLPGTKPPITPKRYAPPTRYTHSRVTLL